VNGELYDEPYVHPESRSAEHWGPEVIPDGQYFVMGDRRNDSSDSRHWENVPARYIVGRVTIRWWRPADVRRY
jgi:signal peptidase I